MKVKHHVSCDDAKKWGNNNKQYVNIRRGCCANILIFIYRDKSNETREFREREVYDVREWIY